MDDSYEWSIDQKYWARWAYALPDELADFNLS